MVGVENYKWYGFNRPFVHRKARKGSGGDGILVKHSFLLKFKPEVIDKDFDSIMALKFSSDYYVNFIVCVCYLPPVNSVHANSSEFFMHLTSLYLKNECNNIFICGDFNARIGDSPDTTSLDDAQLHRQVIDLTKNSYCEIFTEFLKDCKLCMLNGRITQDLNDYTFFSTGGKV